MRDDRRWRVRCRVSGGVTGTREAWLKSDGIVADFVSEAEAQRTADECRTRAGRLGTGTLFEYWPVRVADWPQEEA